MRWMWVAVAAVIAVAALAFPSLDRLQSRAEDAIDPGWVSEEVFRDGGQPVVGPRANVTIRAVPGPGRTGSDPLQHVCPGAVIDTDPGGAMTHCSSITMDVEAVLVSGADTRITVTVYRRASWLLIPAFAGTLLIGVAWFVRRT